MALEFWKYIVLGGGIAQCVRGNARNFSVSKMSRSLPVPTDLMSSVFRGLFLGGKAAGAGG
jgi:hypothetical protein